MKQILYKMTLFLLAVSLLLPCMTTSVSATAETVQPTGLEGKTISILGDSISTYAGVSNNAQDNVTLAGSAVYYQPGSYGIYQADTWWQQAADRLGMELLVNNSWSGSHIYKTGAGTVGAYIDRCVQLHNNQGIAPDVIAVYLGTNDFGGSLYNLGSAEAIDYQSLITETESGYQYAQPSNVCEAYAIMLHKMTIHYPLAEIYCMTPLPRPNPELAQLAEDFNASLGMIATHFGAYTVDLYNRSGIKADGNFQTYVADGLHPYPAGMDAITGCLVSSILENSSYVTQKVYPVAYSLDGVSVDQGTAYAVLENGPFHCTITGLLGYDLDVKVTMGEEDITATCYAGGEIRIEAVTGPVCIRASSVLPGRADAAYRWKFDGTELVPAEDAAVQNALTRLEGMIIRGVHLDSRYQLEKTIVLKHDCPWALEWNAISTRQDVAGGALLFATAEASTTKNTTYLYLPRNMNFLALGFFDGIHFQNYGVNLSDSGLDLSAEHTYRLENRLAEDGSNMVYLFVDGVQQGPMNQYYLGETNKNTTTDWVNGKDFVFSYMGTADHAISLCRIDYIQVSECRHSYGGWTVSDQETHTRVCGFCQLEETAAHTGNPCEVCGEKTETPAVIYGDANGDGAVNAKDAMLVLQFYTQKITEGKLDLKAVDVDGNDTVNAKDAMLILQKYTKKIESFPIEAK